MKYWTADDGVKIAYEVYGEAGHPAVILQHGFASHLQGEWKSSGIAQTLVDGGRYVIIMHARGHGASDKPHDSAFYGEVRMAKDLRGVADAEGLTAFDLGGYSMGAVISLLVASEETRIGKLLIGGVGEGILARGGVDTRAAPNQLIVDALTAETPEEAPEITRGFRLFADSVGADRLALAAQARVVHQDKIPLEQISAQSCLVVAGDDDYLAINPGALAEALPNASLFVGKGDHLGIFGNAEFRDAITRYFLGE
ncbi:alpha/beta fold hydrolase [Maricaulis parjimensis]|uniref:alpha/beta fold hydrolase n=1 Tax=Maricaulis parjimensis TaxID=144023 RepID=UPI00193A2F99|nr:alpha/beta fold hydrolase [Maricaulis parjimensis]